MNYTGVTQDFTNVEVGDELSITASGYTPSDDSVLGNNNRVVIKWDFVDTGGNVSTHNRLPIDQRCDPATPKTLGLRTPTSPTSRRSCWWTARAVILFVQEADEGGASPSTLLLS